ncbi:hypothetical protein ACFFX0_05535 [Citricoccus parietis]|uniref:Uncharacterized protein n=1 Tax=Citricoccus parietis TaxID=592307 RepID=A0ABV5FVH0_9MICC
MCGAGRCPRGCSGPAPSGPGPSAPAPRRPRAWWPRAPRSVMSPAAAPRQPRPPRRRRGSACRGAGGPSPPLPGSATSYPGPDVPGG